MRINQDRLKEAVKYQLFFAKKYPKCFVLEGKPKKPLALGTYEALCKVAEQHDEISKRGVSRFLRLYSSSEDYIKATLKPKAMRVDLEGNPVESVSKVHRALARKEPRTVKFSETRTPCEGSQRKRIIRRAQLKRRAARRIVRAAERKELKLKCKAVVGITKAAFMKCKTPEQVKYLHLLIKYLQSEMPNFMLSRKNFLFPVAANQRQTLIQRVQAAHPEIGQDVITFFWSSYTSHIRYLVATIKSSHFLDFEGSPILEISAGAKTQTGPRVEKAQKIIGIRLKSLIAKREKKEASEAAPQKKKQNKKSASKNKPPSAKKPQGKSQRVAVKDADGNVKIEVKRASGSRRKR